MATAQDQTALARAVMVLVVQARVATARAVMSKEDVVATRAVMVLWTAALLTTAITVVTPPAKTLAAMEAAAASKATAIATRTRIVTRPTEAIVTATRKVNINRTH